MQKVIKVRIPLDPVAKARANKDCELAEKKWFKAGDKLDKAKKEFLKNLESAIKELLK